MPPPIPGIRCRAKPCPFEFTTFSLRFCLIEETLHSDLAVSLNLLALVIGFSGGRNAGVSLHVPLRVRTESIVFLEPKHQDS